MGSTLEAKAAVTSRAPKKKVVPNPDPKPVPKRNKTSDGLVPKERLTSDPNSRNNITGTRTETVVKDGGEAEIGCTVEHDPKEADAKAKEATEASQRTTTGASGNAFTAQGILGCIGTLPAVQAGVLQRGVGADGCSDCSTIDCLADLLFGNILSLLDKSTLCRFQNAFSKSIKNQINATSNALMRAASEAASAKALIAGLQDIRSFINSLDPGLLAQCFGAERLKDWINGQFETAQNAIQKYETGKNNAVANAFNSASEMAQQIGNLGSEFCE